MDFSVVDVPGRGVDSRLRAWSGHGSRAPLEPDSLPCPVRLPYKIIIPSRMAGDWYPVGESPLGCGLGQGTALGLHWSPIHYRARFDSPTK